MNRKNQRGFTIVELAIAGCGLVAIAGGFAVAYIVVHFIAKFW